MKLDEVSSGAVYADTNVLYMYLRADPAHLPAIRSFFRSMVRGEIEVFVGIPVLDELFYRLLLARLKDGGRGNPLDALRRDLPGALAAHAPLVGATLRKMVALPHLHLVGVEVADFDGMLRNIAAFSLLPRDALHIAILQRLGLTAIASDDGDFDRVEAIERHRIVNPP